MPSQAARNSTGTSCNVWTYCDRLAGCPVGADRHGYQECTLMFSDAAAAAMPLGNVAGLGQDPSHGTVRGDSVTLISGAELARARSGSYTSRKT